MSISSAFETGVSGLQANSRAVGSTSENIANANTIGYRRGFTSMVTSTASTGGESGILSVIAVDQLDMNRPGGLFATDSPTDLAISGQGFFVVARSPTSTSPSNFMMTRAGSFLPDSNGDLVNAAGFYLTGFPYRPDGTLGTVDRNSFQQMKPVNVGNVKMAATATKAVTINGNLPSQDTGLATPGAPFTISAEVFSALGQSERVGLSWQPTSTSNEWELTVSDHNGTALGQVTVTFNDSGADAGSPLSYTNITSLATAPSAFGFDASSGEATLTLNNGTAPQVVTLDLGAPNTFDGISQFSGDFTQVFKSDGSSTGNLTRIEIDEDGIMYGVFDNGQRNPLYEIPIAVIDNPAGLYEERGNAYTLSGESGGFRALQAGSGTAGAMNAGALEGSNVDIAEELTDLIQIQRAYSNNAKVVTTADEMMDETTRLKR